MSTGEHDLETPGPTSEVDGAEGEATPKKKLELDVQITDIGPCKKHVKVAIAPAEIERQFKESFGAMQKEAQVPGFRPGHAPRPLVEKRFRKQVGEQVKSTLLMGALEQIDADFELNPITQPDLDVNAIELPAEGPMEFEMDVEVRPDFEAPAYKTLTVKRPTRTISADEVDAQYKRFLERYGQLVPKLDAGAELGDQITADLRFHRGEKVYNEVKEVSFRLQDELRFQDGSVSDLAGVLRGARPGETRQADALIGQSSPDPELRGQTIRVDFAVQDLKTFRLPEVNREFLQDLGFDSVEDLRDALREALERRLAAQQRQAVRHEVLDQLIAATPFDLPEELVARQEKTTLRRIVAQMKQEGFTEDDIRARAAELRANAKDATLRSLKEFFILAKVAEVEDIKVDDEDLELEVERIADRSGESPRRVRARIEKEGLADAMASDILERKTLDRILEFVQFEEVALAEQKDVETLDQTASAVTAEEDDESTPAD